MPATASQNLIRLIGQNRLLDEGRQAELSRFEDMPPKKLAQELINRDWLSSFQINYLLQGKSAELTLGGYQLLSRVGEGAMGQVYKARSLKDERIVALKVLRADAKTNQRTFQRFQREMRVLQQMSHPNIVRAYEADCAGKDCFIAMEFIAGPDLARHVKHGGPLPVAQAVSYLRQAAEALQAVHELGLVHRDVKPANLLVVLPEDLREPERSQYPLGLVKLLDLGLARWDDDPNLTNLTQAGAVLGTPDFLAPEQAESSKTCDIRADIYSLGCAFYYLLTGSVPFLRATFMERVLAHKLEAPTPVEQARRARWQADRDKGESKLAESELRISPELEAVLAKMMAKKPEDRFQSPRDIVRALEESTRAKPIVAAPQGARRRWLWLAGVVGLCMLGWVAVGKWNASAPVVPGPPAPKRPAKIDAWAEALARFRKPGVAPDAARGELLAYRQDHPLAPSAAEFARAMAEPRSPLDDWKGFVHGKSKTAAPIGAATIASPGKVTRFQTLALSPRLSTLIAGAEAKILHFHTAAPAVPTEYPDALKQAERIVFSPDGASLAMGGKDGKLWFFADASSTLNARTLEMPADRTVRHLAFAPSGKTLAAAGDGGPIQIWDVASGLKRGAPLGDDVAALTFTPDGKLLFWLTTSGMLRWADAQTGQILDALELTKAKIAKANLGFHPQGEYLYVALPGQLRSLIWYDQRLKSHLQTFVEGINDLAISLDGNRLATASADGKIRLWDPRSLTSSELAKLPAPATDLAFASDGRHLLVAGGSIHLFRLPR